MEPCTTTFLIVGGLAFLAYFLIDVNYFIRTAFTIVWGKLFLPKLNFLGVSEIYGMVLPSDSDTLLTHMNNARVFREFDFGRWDHTARTGLMRISFMGNGGGVVGAHAIRYRRPLHMFMVYKIVTTPVYYESKFIYLEQKIVTLSDDIIRAVAYVKLVFNFDLDKITATHYPKTVKPEMPEDLQQWIKFNKLNSERLNVESKMLVDDKDVSSKKPLAHDH